MIHRLPDGDFETFSARPSGAGNLMADLKATGIVRVIPPPDSGGGDCLHLRKIPVRLPPQLFGGAASVNVPQPKFVR